MGSKRSEREKFRNSLTGELLGGQLPDDDFSQSPIDKLPVDCLISIFSLLPIVDRVRIQSVCRHWRDVSLKSWFSCKTLSFQPEDWGYEYWLDDKGINLNVLRKVLKLCGPHIRRVNFGVHDYGHSLKIKISKCSLVLIKNLCPKLTAIDISCLNVTRQGLEYLVKNYSNLTEFGISNCGEKLPKFDKLLSLLFQNNPNLRCLDLNLPLSGNCLLNLNPIAIEEIHMVHGSGADKNIICSALQKFINLRIFAIIDWTKSYYDSNYINEMLKAIEPHSENLKELELFTINTGYPDEIHSNSFKCFRNLQKLSINTLYGNMDFYNFETITEYCTELTVVELSGLPVTDLQMIKIIQLPKLRELCLDFLDEVSDAIFINQVSSLESLKCFGCSRLTNFGLRKFLQNSSKNLQRLVIMQCKKVDLQKLIKDAKEATDSRSIDSSLLKMTVKKTALLRKEKVTNLLSPYLQVTEYIS